jgi:hypothetical protein
MEKETTVHRDTTTATTPPASGTASSSATTNDWLKSTHAVTRGLQAGREQIKGMPKTTGTLVTPLSTQGGELFGAVLALLGHAARQSKTLQLPNVPLPVAQVLAADDEEDEIINGENQDDADEDDVVDDETDDEDDESDEDETDDEDDGDEEDMEIEDQIPQESLEAWEAATEALILENAKLLLLDVLKKLNAMGRTVPWQPAPAGTLDAAIEVECERLIRMIGVIAVREVGMTDFQSSTPMMVSIDRKVGSPIHRELKDQEQKFSTSITSLSSRIDRSQLGIVLNKGS